MSRKTFKKDVYIKVPLEITLDERGFNEDFFREFSRYMHDVDKLEDIADFIALQIAIFENPYVEFIGYTMINGKEPQGIKDEAINKYVDVKVPYFKYDNRVIGNSFLEDEFNQADY